MYYDRVKAYFYRDSGTTQIMLGICMLSMPGLYRFAFDLCSPTPTVVELLQLAVAFRKLRGYAKIDPCSPGCDRQSSVSDGIGH